MGSKTETLASVPLPLKGESRGGLPGLQDEDWSFASLKPSETLWGPHGYHRYPAKFIPHLVRRIIDRYSAPGDLVGDSFVGSATTGVEALRSGRRFWGSDINPVALLISQAKCRPLPPEDLRRNWERLWGQLKAVKRVGRRALTAQESAAILAIDSARATAEERLTYWFPQAYREALAEIISEISNCPDEASRTFYLCAFSNILKRCSIWLSGSTKPQKDLKKFLSDPLEEFQKQTQDMLKRNTLYWDDLVAAGCDPSRVKEHFSLLQADARNLPLQAGCLDLLVTSPPYATCYEYSELHQLTSLWFTRYQVFSEIQEEATYIGTKDSSKRKQNADIPLPPSAERALMQLRAKAKGTYASAVLREADQLASYFQDMCLALREGARVLAARKYMVLIIGDSYRREITIPTSAALSEMAGQLGFVLEQRIVRRVPARILVIARDRKTGRFSSHAPSGHQAYPEEDILVFRKSM